MAEIGLKIHTGDINIELNGEADIVKNIFNDIRENGLGKIAINLKEQCLKPDDTIVGGTEDTNKKLKNEDKKKPKRSKAVKAPGNITASYELVELNMNQEERNKFKEEYANYKTNTNVQQILVLAHLLNKFIGLKTINTNVIFTALRTVGEKSSFNIPQTFRNMKNRNRFLIEAEETGEYKLTPIGEDEISYNLTLQQEGNK